VDVKGDIELWWLLQLCIKIDNATSRNFVVDKADGLFFKVFVNDKKLMLFHTSFGW